MCDGKVEEEESKEGKDRVGQKESNKVKSTMEKFDGVRQRVKYACHDGSGQG